jgi:hypothetical protein
MGIAARAKKGKRIKIEKGDFFELIAALRAHELKTLEARDRAAKLAMEIVQRDIAESGKKGRAIVQRLATKYGFSPDVTFGWDEATCELLPRETAAP